MVLWELRFIDGRGSSLYTITDVTGEIGKPETVRHIPIAGEVSQASPLRDAERCFAEGKTTEASAQMTAVAYAIRHELALQRH